MMTATAASRKPLAPVRRVDLVREVGDRLREEIVAGQYDPSGLLPTEGKLAETFGVSRTVVREAMRTLRAQGLVEVSQGRRPRVRPADPTTAADSLRTLLERGNATLLNLVEARRPLEAEIAALAAHRATLEQIDAMQQAIDQMNAAPSLAGKIEADIAFHDLLAAATGNPIFQLMLATLAELMRQSRQQTITSAGLEVANRGHVEVLAAVRAKDPQAAGAAMLEHLELARRHLRGDDV